MADIIDLKKERARRAKSRSQGDILEFLKDAGINLEVLEVQLDDGSEFTFEPEDSNDS